jgi:F-type H+-transporting ATPase subunit delta
MAELSTLAKPYAKAAFDYAKEHNAINEWERFLSVASSIVDNEEFTSILNNPAISAPQKTTILMDVYTKQASGDSLLAKTLDSVASHGIAPNLYSIQ